MPNIVILGSGNLAYHLALALNSAGFKIIQIFSKNMDSVKELAKKTNSNFTTDIKDLNITADIYFFCMNDKANIEIADKISFKNDPILAHTAGSQSMHIFNKLTVNFAAFYPFQTFSKNIDTDFSKVPVCIESSNVNTANILKQIANSLGCNSYDIDEKGRATLHLCGVFAANFMNHCVSISEELLKINGIDQSLIKPLLEQSFYKIINNGALKSQTGPALREDTQTINKHMKLLKNQKQYSEVYKVLTESIIEWKKKN